MKKTIFILLILVLFHSVVSAKERNVTSNSISGNAWNTSSSINIGNIFVPTAQTSTGEIRHRTKSLRAGFKLYLNTLDFPANVPDFTAKVVVNLDYKLDDNIGSVSQSTHTLTVDFKTNTDKYKNIDIVYIDNVLDIKASITSIQFLDINANPIATVTPDQKKMVQAQTFIQQEYFENLSGVFGTNLPSSLSQVNNITVIPNAINTTINWSFNNVPHEGFEVEYTFIDDYSGDPLNSSTAYLNPNAINFSFKNNSTRVLVDKPPFLIPNTFEHGYIVVRVRPYTMAGNNFTQIIYGNFPSNSTGVSLNLGTYPAKGFITNNLVYNADLMNWQSVTSFAEGNKRKTVVKLMDGTFRERQILTKDNTNNNVIVAETIYDFHGRPAVNILPVPIRGNKDLFYKPKLNQNLSGNSYTFADFDIPASDACSPNTVNPLKQTNNVGAANYYSPSNAQLGRENAFIPDANGYPFTRAIYIPDLTGRVVKQGGVGEIFQPGNTVNKTYQNHDTKYYYGAPDQQSLNYLFGTEVGYESFYQKNLVVDPNGQVSVSYVDLDGKTIATALAGESPNSVDRLSSYQTTNISVDILSKNDIINEQDHSITNSRAFLVSTNNTPYSFRYTIDKQTINLLSCRRQDYCLDCIYDIEISLVRDDCNKVEFNETRTLGKLNELDFDCNIEGVTSRILWDFQKTVNLNIGSYTITKKLKVNNQAANIYIDKVIAHATKNHCIKTFDDFYNEAWAKRDTSRCKDACNQCNDVANAEPMPERTQYLADCDKEYCHPNIGNMCDVGRIAMISDLKPGGQYAICKLSDGSIDLNASPISIFNQSSPCNIKTLYNSSSLLNGITFDLPGQSNINLNTYLSSGGSMTNLILNWPDDLSEKLLPLHPEYCYLKFCSVQEIEQSNEYDTKFMTAETWADAQAAGITVANLMANDPFKNYLSNSIFSSTNIATAFSTKYGNYDNNNNSIPTMALFYANCPSATTMSGCSGAWADGLNDDEEWDRFKVLYYNLKQEFIAKAREIYAQQCATQTPAYFTNTYIGCDPNNVCPAPIWPISPSSPNPCPPSILGSAVYQLYYKDAKRRFVNINDVSLPGITPSSTSVYDNTNLINNSSDIQNQALAQMPCGACPEMEVFKAMVAFLAKKQWLTGNVTKMADQIPGMASPLRDRFLGSTANGTITISTPGSTQLILSSSNCTITLTSDKMIDWANASIIPTCLGINDYKNAFLNINVNDTMKAKLTIVSTCDIFYCDGKKFVDTSGTPPCDCKSIYNASTSYTVGAIVSYNNKCYILNKGTSLNNLTAGIAPTTSAYWSLLCEKLTPPCEDALAENFETNVTFNSALVVAASGQSPGSGQYSISSQFSNSTTNTAYNSGALIAYPAAANSIIYGKTISVQANKNYKINLNASYAFNSLAPGSIQGISIKVNGNVLMTYPSLSSTWTSISIPFSSGINTMLNLEILATASGAKDVIALDDIHIQCLGDNFSSASVTTAPNNNANTANQNKSSQRYIPDNNCDCDLCDLPLPLPDIQTIPCDSILKDIARQQAHTAYQNYLDSLSEAYLAAYYAKCMQAFERFKMDYVHAEYHYTLYYYDQSGNLVKTIPPQGFKPHIFTDVQIDNARNTNGTALRNPHYMASTYKHNALNAVHEQHTPDAGKSNFYYDRLGRICASINAVQASNNTGAYTMYDALGRITEVGKLNAMVNTTALASNNINTWRTWIQTQNRTEITRTFYDLSADISIANAFGTNTPNFLRNRVATIATYVDNTKTTLQYEQATHYRYDISGNVVDLFQDYGHNSPFGNGSIAAQSKRMLYDFDLISGKVNALYYEPGKADQFLYKYQYDVQNRITQALHSSDGMIWERDANYYYYAHSPLARTEIGTDNVQGVDYLYNLQGWIKGMNGFSKDYNSDAGFDGNNLPTPSPTSDPGEPLGYSYSHNKFATDAASYWLGYFQDDYKPIGISGTQIQNVVQPLTNGAYNTNPAELFNGNIRSMYTRLQPKGGLAMQYRYDQLHRIKQQDAYDFGMTGTIGTAMANNAYQMKLTYDANGNILTLFRNGDATNGIAMDDLKYSYTNYNTASNTSTDVGYGNAYNCNRLAHVDDAVPSSAMYDDVNNQNNSNYAYDAIGNLTRDNSEGISLIQWNLQNKISKINKGTGATALTLQYEYDPNGKRIQKTNIRPGQPDTSTVYVLDPQGNTLAIYRVQNNNLTWQEQHLYGSSRLGLVHTEKALPKIIVSTGGGTGSSTSNSGPGGSMTTPISIGNIDITNIGGLSVNPNILAFVQGTPKTTHSYRNTIEYELTNHLSNVLATVSDAKLSTSAARILSHTDYYAFGMAMKDRTSSSYRYDYNGKPTDKETGLQDYGFRIYNAGLGRFLSVDPLTMEYPWYTPYQFAGNKVIESSDIDGLEENKEVSQFSNFKLDLSKTNYKDIKAKSEALVFHSDFKSPFYNKDGKPLYKEKPKSLYERASEKNFDIISGLVIDELKDNEAELIFKYGLGLSEFAMEATLQSIDFILDPLVVGDQDPNAYNRFMANEQIRIKTTLNEEAKKVKIVEKFVRSAKDKEIDQAKPLKTDRNQSRSLTVERSIILNNLKNNKIPQKPAQNQDTQTLLSAPTYGSQPSAPQNQGKQAITKPLPNAAPTYNVQPK